MAANDALVHSVVEDTKVDFGEAQFNGDDAVKVCPNAETILFLDSDKLEQYRKEKKYVFIRYGLIIAFWLVWVALIGGAIAIILFSPRAKTDPSHERSATYEVFLPSLNDGLNGFDRLKGQIDHLKLFGVNTLLISPIFKYDSNAADHTDVEDYVLEDSVGTKEELVELIKAIHSADMKVIADVPLKLLAKKDANLDGLYTKKSGDDILDLNKPAARAYLLNGLKSNLVDLDGASFDGAYIHEPRDTDVDVESYNRLLEEAKGLPDEGESSFPSDFVFVIAADYVKGQKINAEVIYNRFPRLSTVEDVVEKLTTLAAKAVEGNKTFTPVLSSADMSRFATKNRPVEVLKLVNGIQLFAFPQSHLLYGEEYGQYCNDVPSLCVYPRLDYHSLAHNATIPEGGADLKKSAEKINHLHRELVSNSTIVMKASITRKSIDDHFYSFVYNVENTTSTIKYSEVIPAQLIPNLKVVSIDGFEDDFSEKADEFAPYEFKILKFLKLD